MNLVTQYLRLVLLFFIAASAGAQQPASAGDLDSLLAQIPEVAKEGVEHGVGPKVEKLADEIQRYGALAVPPMIDLLSAKHDQVRLFAGYVVRDLNGVTEANLDALIAARRRGDGWIAPAIGRIGSPRAVAFLIEDLKAKPEAGQTSWGLVLAGENAAPSLAALFRESRPMPDDLLAVTGHILSEMGAKATPAVSLLLATVSDSSVLPENRVFAVWALGALRQLAIDAVPSLIALAKSEPDRFKAPVEEAILNIGGNDSIEIIVARLRAAPSVRSGKGVRLLFVDISPRPHR